MCFTLISKYFFRKKTHNASQAISNDGVQNMDITIHGTEVFKTDLDIVVMTSGLYFTTLVIFTELVAITCRPLKLFRISQRDFHIFILTFHIYCEANITCTSKHISEYQFLVRWPAGCSLGEWKDESSLPWLRIVSHQHFSREPDKKELQTECYWDNPCKLAFIKFMLLVK